MPRWYLDFAVVLATDSRAPTFHQNGYCNSESLPAVLSTMCQRFIHIMPVETQIIEVKAAFSSGSGPKFKAGRVCKIGELQTAGAELGRELQTAYDFAATAKGARSKREEPIAAAQAALQRGVDVLGLVESLGPVLGGDPSGEAIDLKGVDLGGIVGQLSAEDKAAIAKMLGGS